MSIVSDMQAGASTTPCATKDDRVFIFDFIKGALVVVMVAYHSVNYFRHDREILKYLHFLPASFIFITGFLITQVYLPRCRKGDRGVYSRLLLRGVKLIALFTVLNLATHALFSSNYNRRPLGLDYLFDHLDSIFLTGEERAAVFEVLLPIGYLLLISTVLLRATRWRTWTLPSAALGAVTVCTFLAAEGLLVFNLDLLSLGVLGMLAGLIPVAHMNRLTGAALPMLLAYVAYVAAVTYRYPTYAMNLVGVPLSLLVIYVLGVRLGDTGMVRRTACLLGRYSLVGYIGQIAFLQVAYRAFRAAPIGGFALSAAFVLTLVFTIVLARITEWLRLRSPHAARAYRAIFA